MKVQSKSLRQSGFSDVKESDWSYKYIMKMLEDGVINGYEDGTFRPKNEITRAEIAVMLTKMYK